MTASGNDEQKRDDPSIRRCSPLRRGVIPIFLCRKGSVFTFVGFHGGAASDGRLSGVFFKSIAKSFGCECHSLLGFLQFSQQLGFTSWTRAVSRPRLTCKSPRAGNSNTPSIWASQPIKGLGGGSCDHLRGCLNAGVSIRPLNAC